MQQLSRPALWLGGRAASSGDAACAARYDLGTGRAAEHMVRWADANVTARAKGFVVGFAAATALFICGAFVWDGLHDAMVRSKSKRFFAFGSLINDAIVRYREQNVSYPSSKEVLLKSLPRNDGDFDYFTDGATYTLVCPSLTGKTRWEPYVFRNGRLVAWPTYADWDVKHPYAPRTLQQ